MSQVDSGVLKLAELYEGCPQKSPQSYMEFFAYKPLCYDASSESHRVVGPNKMKLCLRIEMELSLLARAVSYLASSNSKEGLKLQIP
jgi:hypothetical protein